MNLSILMDHLLEAVLVVDRQFNLLFSNQSAKDLFRWSMPLAEPQDVRSALRSHLLLGSRHDLNLEEALLKAQQGQSLHFPQGQVLLSGEKPKPVSIRIKPLDPKEPEVLVLIEPDQRQEPAPGDQSKLEHLVQERTQKLEQEVYERRAIAKALLRSEEKFRDIAESASDWFWEMDQDYRFTYISQRFYEVSKTQPAEVIGKTRWEFVDPQQLEKEPKKWQEHIASLKAKKPFRQFEYNITRPDGSEILISLSGRPAFDGENRFLGYRGTGTDITQLNLAQKKLLQSEKMAALGRLVAGVAHEINTPVGIGVTAASHLEELTKDLLAEYHNNRMSRSALEDYLQQMAQGTSSILKNLIRASELIRSFKQVAVDQTSDEKRTFSMRQYIDEVLLNLSPRHKRTEHVIQVVCPEDLVVESYPGAWAQIITNLVINSLLHGLEGMTSGMIRMEVFQKEGNLHFLYEDNGKGMSAEAQSRVFEPFYSTKREQGGSGLGMNIVYNLVTQKLAGEILCHSGPRQGVHFSIKTPCRAIP